MGLTDILTTFKGFFSRSFWFGSFLPVAIFAAIHLVIAWWVGTGFELSTIVSADTSKLITVPLALFGLIVLAYAVTPLIALVQGLLDGSLLPQPLHDWLRCRHMVEARAARARVDEATAQFNKMGELSLTTTSDLQNARNEGNDRGALPRGLLDAQPFQDVTTKIDSLHAAFDGGTPPKYEDLKAAADSLAGILKAYKTSVDSAQSDEIKKAAEKLSQAQGRMTELVKDADTDGAHQLQSVLERNSRIAYDNPQATRMADIRLLAERYCRSAYGVEFDYIWPRLQFAVPAQNATGDTGSLSDKLGMTRAHIHFSVLSLALSLTVSFGWLPYLLFAGGDPLKFVAIAAGGARLPACFLSGKGGATVAIGAGGQAGAA